MGRWELICSFGSVGREGKGREGGMEQDEREEMEGMA